MENHKPHSSCSFSLKSCAVLAGALVFLCLSVSAQAQTFTVLHDFTGYSGGSDPVAGLTMAGPGDFYGTTAYGGSRDAGTVFNLKRAGSGWILTFLYSFQGGADGAEPYAPVTIGPDGSLYGTTYEGGSLRCGIGCGTVYRLTPPATFCRSASCPWTETVMYLFQNTDGAGPAGGKLIFDQAGNLYGTTYYGGTNGGGTVFELSPSSGGWSETVLHSFSGSVDGFFPWSGVIFDSGGNLYGTTESGGANSAGTVYELSPSGSGWTKSTFSFDGGSQGNGAVGGVVMDAQGHLYGSTISGGSGGGGTAYQLSPFNGQWNFTLLAALPSAYDGPLDNPTLDAAGNVYLTSKQGLGNGAVLEVSPSNGGWQLSVLHAFGGSDGAWPTGNLILDASGNIYGTASQGGDNNNGLVWEITP